MLAKNIIYKIRKKYDIHSMFKNDQNVKESLLASLFQIALADGIIHQDEDKFLLEVANCFGLSDKDFNRIRSSFITSNVFITTKRLFV